MINQIIHYFKNFIPHEIRENFSITIYNCPEEFSVLINSRRQPPKIIQPHHYLNNDFHQTIFQPLINNNINYNYIKPQNQNDFIEHTIYETENGNNINFIQESNQHNKNNQENPIPPEKKHLRGLVNIASTCYINSILQCFCNIKELAVYFQSDKMNKLIINYKYDSNKFFPVFQEVIKQLWDPKDNSPYSPYDFKNRLGDMNPLFRGAIPNDAKDLLTFILLQLHEELNKQPNNNNINNNINENMQHDKKLMFQNFCKFFINNYRSIISDLFFGIFYTETQCINGHTFYNYQTFNFIIFPLEKVLQYRNASNNVNSNFNNTITIKDCFKYYEFPTFLNDYYCNICRNQGNCKYTNKLSVLPNILIIILNRGKGLEFNVKLSFENENLGLAKYVEYCKDETIYELIGMVTHYGESSANGHFVARCKSPIDGEWYLYNDQIVKNIGYFNNESFAQGNTYILFYKKINFKNNK